MQRVSISQVQKFMRDIGIPRGFEQGTLNRKIRNGTFNVPYIKIGLVKYFKEDDIIQWLEGQDKYND